MCAVFKHRCEIKQERWLAESTLKDPLSMMKPTDTGFSFVVPFSSETPSSTIVMRDVKEIMGQTLWQEDLECASHCKSFFR